MNTADEILARICLDDGMCEFRSWSVLGKIGSPDILMMRHTT